MSLEPLVGSLTDTDTDTRNKTDNGDHERFAHYAPKSKITESFVYGIALIALCGKIWVPSRDPNKYPVCPECKEAYESIGNLG